MLSINTNRRYIGIQRAFSRRFIFRVAKKPGCWVTEVNVLGLALEVVW